MYRSPLQQFGGAVASNLGQEMFKKYAQDQLTNKLGTTLGGAVGGPAGAVAGGALASLLGFNYGTKKVGYNKGTQAAGGSCAQCGMMYAADGTTGVKCLKCGAATVSKYADGSMSVRSPLGASIENAKDAVKRMNMSYYG